jgi:hypothetical protein
MRYRGVERTDSHTTGPLVTATTGQDKGKLEASGWYT